MGSDGTRLQLLTFTGNNIYEFSHNGDWQQIHIDSLPMENYIITVGKGRNDSLNRIYVGCGNGYIYEYTWINENVDENSCHDMKNLFSLYPNPFSYKTNLILHTQSGKNSFIKIYDTQGRLLNKIKIPSVGSDKFTVSWPDRNTNLPAGIYFCVFYAGNNFQTIKMIKLK